MKKTGVGGLGTHIHQKKKTFCASGKGSQQAAQARRPKQAGRCKCPGTAGGRRPIFTGTVNVGPVGYPLPDGATNRGHLRGFPKQ